MTDSELDEAMDGVLTHLKESSEEIGPQLKPDEDWMPVIFGICPTEDEKFQIVVLGLGMDMNDTAQKQTACETVIPEALQKFGAVGAAFLSTVWTIKEDAPDEASDPKRLQEGISESPFRTEALFITTLLNDGKFSMHQAYIERHDGSHPTLGDWECKIEGVIGDDENFGLGGRFHDAMAKGIGLKV